MRQLEFSPHFGLAHSRIPGGFSLALEVKASGKPLGNVTIPWVYFQLFVNSNFFD